MRAVAVHSDAIVVTSRLWQTTCTAVRSGSEGMLIDSPYFPDELELLPTLLSQAGFVPNGLLVTHADYDHLLGRLAFFFFAPQYFENHPTTIAKEWVPGDEVVDSFRTFATKRGIKFTPEEFRLHAHHWLILHGRYV